MVPVPARVLSTTRETHDTVTMTLALARPSQAFRPGQFNMLYAFGVGEIPVSMSGDPAREDVAVHTVRDVGAVSKALCRVAPGDVLGLRGPYGTGWPVELPEGSDLVIVGGGLGLAPLRPAIYHAIAHRSRYRNVAVIAGARTPSDIPFQAELEQLRERADLTVLVTVDRAPVGWSGWVGVVPALVGKLGLEPQRTFAFVCGPEVMMRFAIRELGRRGIADDRIYLSMERNMECAIGLCGHCQYREQFVCKDGPVLRYDRIRDLFWLREV